MNKRNPLIAAAISGLILGGSACASSKAAETSSTPAAQEKASCKAAEGGDKASCKGAEGGDKASCKDGGEKASCKSL